MKTGTTSVVTIGSVLLAHVPLSAQAVTSRPVTRTVAAPVLAVPRSPSGEVFGPTGSTRILRPSPRAARRATASGKATASTQPGMGVGSLLPEGYHLAGREGVLSRGKHGWVFTAAASDAGPDILPLRLLPCRDLEHIEAVAQRDATARRFRLSGMVTEYGGVNYLLVDRALLSPNQTPPGDATPRKTASRPATTRPGVPSATDVLSVLARDRQAEPLPTRAKSAVARARRQAGPSGVGRGLPDGTVFIDRVGRLVQDADGWLFVFESGGGAPTDAPIRILPSRLLETMESASADGTAHMTFVISGEVVSYHWRSFLLLRKVLIHRNLGNLR